MIVRWACASHTHAGKKRGANEDALLCLAERGLWAVADGMGGHAAGDRASQAVVTALAQLRPRTTLADSVDQVDDLLALVNAELRAQAKDGFEGRTPGSTVVAMLAREQAGVALWAGDSRLYRLRGSALAQITRDHNPLADLLEDGLISEQAALTADTNVITRAVGAQPVLHLDLVLFDIAPWDTFLLCSDGLYRELDHAALASALAADDVEQAADRLLREALEQGARDNVSLVVARAEC